MAELRRLSTHCKFGAFLDEALRDRLVCGLRSESIQKKLLTEADLTLTKAINLSVGMEAADKNAKSLKGPDVAVNRVTLKQKACYRCGRTSHDQSECKFREAECHNCGKRGHIAPVCRSPNTQEQANTEEHSEKPCKYSSRSSALCRGHARTGASRRRGAHPTPLCGGRIDTSH